MVRAILDGRKTQTRRIIKFKRLSRIRRGRLFYSTTHDSWAIDGGDASLELVECPFGRVGNRLWVREAWCGKVHPLTSQLLWRPDGNTYEVHYRADGEDVFLDDGDGFTCRRKDGTPASPWRPSIYMPRWASRITLEITDVRVERLNDISEADALAEGCPQCETCIDRCGQWGRGAIDDPLSNAMGGQPWRACGGICDGLTAKEWFSRLWDSINGERPGCSWGDNPWIWALSFRRAE
jgi:hypothetical protein